MAAGLLAGSSALIAATPQTLSFQGRIADTGTNFNGLGLFQILPCQQQRHRNILEQ